MKLLPKQTAGLYRRDLMTQEGIASRCDFASNGLVPLGSVRMKRGWVARLQGATDG